MTKTYKVERATLTRDEYAAGLVPAWHVICRDEFGAHVIASRDTRTLAADTAHRLRNSSKG